MEEFGTVGAAEVVFERRIDAPRERVWRALTDPQEGQGGWHLPRSTSGSAARSCSGSTTTTWRGTITELREPDLLAYTWNEGKSDSLVRFELEQDGSGTRLMLRHTFEGEADLPSYGGGWHHHLELLAAQSAGKPIPWDTMRYRELKSEYERRAQQAREAQLARER